MYASVNTYGTPAQIVEKIEQQREILGCDLDVLAITKYGGMTDAEAAASMRLFAHDVMPALRATSGARLRGRVSVVASRRLPASLGTAIRGTGIRRKDLPMRSISGVSLYASTNPAQAYTCKWKLKRTSTSAPAVPTTCP